MLIMPRRSLLDLYREEFRDYSIKKLRADLVAGLTVGAVALPLALAFGVASGGSAAAGLITAILAGLVIGLLSGAPYQISGPTGAMSAVLIVVAQRYGFDAVLLAGFLSGLILLVIGLLKLGRFIAFVPSAVITGFTSGIAIIIVIGQLDNLFGASSIAPTHSLLGKLSSYLKDFPTVNFYALLSGALVMLIMLLWPKRWALRCPASLVAMIMVSFLAYILAWPVILVGDIPRTIFLDQRLDLLGLFESSESFFRSIDVVLLPAITIAALGAVECLLCGAASAKLTGVRLQANQELVAQGVGNLLIPLFGGVPATAAIARSSVGIQAGGKTRLVSVIHALALLGFVLIFSSVMGQIPLAVLAGVLIVTAWRMNDWEAIHFIFSRRFYSAIAAFFVTMLATVVLDLTQAIIIGTVLSGLIFISKISNIDIAIMSVDRQRLKDRGIELRSDCDKIKVAFVTGPLFFAATGSFEESFAQISKGETLILSLRAMPMIDTAGVEVLMRLHSAIISKGGELLLAACTPEVRAMLDRSGISSEVGEQNFFWSGDQAIIEADRRSLKSEA
jgi:SulP family sulfate permease